MAITFHQGKDISFCFHWSTAVTVLFALGRNLVFEKKTLGPILHVLAHIIPNARQQVVFGGRIAPGGFKPSEEIFKTCCH